MKCENNTEMRRIQRWSAESAQINEQQLLFNSACVCLYFFYIQQFTQFFSFIPCLLRAYSKQYKVGYTIKSLHIRRRQTIFVVSATATRNVETNTTHGKRPSNHTRDPSQLYWATVYNISNETSIRYTRFSYIVWRLRDKPNKNYRR